jgi:hypothetical protein
MHRAKTQSDNSKALSAERKASKAIYRRFTQMDTERNPFKNITAEASLDWARDPELVEGQRAQRISFFVCRETTTNKNLSAFRQNRFSQSSSPDWAKILPFAYSASLR